MSYSYRGSIPQSFSEGRTSSQDSNNNMTFMVKFIIVGDSSVGKSNIMLRFSKDIFDDKHGNTLGLEFVNKHLMYNNTDYLIQIFDTAGQDKFKSVIRGYYKGSAVAMVVYDITNEESFNNVKEWINDCQNLAPSTAILALIGNKIDKEKERIITKERGEKLANDYDMMFFETSAKIGNGVNEAFQSCIEALDHRIKDGFYDLDESYVTGIKKFQNGNEISLNGKISDKTSFSLNKKRKKKKCCS